MAAAARRVTEIRRVLVVDDEPGVCELIGDILGKEAFEVTCAGTDRDAYALLEDAPAFDAILVDVNLGRGTTGFDVARFARQRRPALPVVFVSGEASRDSFRAFGVPGSTYLAKPFTTEELIDAVEIALGDA